MVFLMLVSLALLIVLNIDYLWGHSVDLAHHYVLVFRVGEQFNLGNPADPSMGEMNLYPRLSHIFAAIVGFILGSPLLGLNFTALLALFLIWFCYVYLLGTLPRALALASMISLALISLFNKRVLHLEVHGGEIHDNYFFSQLVAQSFSMLVIVLGLICERKAGRWYAYFVLTIGVVINTGVHLLPTLELLGVLAFLVLLDGIKARRDAVRWEIWFLPVVVIPIVALVAVLSNPAFAAMRMIAENNGGLSFERISYPLGLIAVCVTLFIMSIIAAWIYLRPNSRYSWPLLKYLGALGFSMASLCILQILLAQFGYGSDYAAKKYGSGLLTLLLVFASIGVGALLLRLPRINAINLPGWLIPPGVAALFFCIATNATPRNSDFDLSDLIGLEKSLAGLLSSQYTPAVVPKQDVVIDVSKTPTFDYMFSLAISRTSREYATPEVYSAHAIADLNNYENVITARGAPRYDNPKCRLNSNRLLVVNSAACLAAEADKVEKARTEFDFSSQSTLPQGSVDGFSIPEPHGRWMLSASAKFTWLQPSIQPSAMIVELAPYLNVQHPEQRLLIKVNGNPVYEGVYRYNEPIKPFEVIMPTVGAKSYFIEFSTPDAVSPKALGLGDDTRELSFSLKRLSFK